MHRRRIIVACAALLAATLAACSSSGHPSTRSASSSGTPPASGAPQASAVFTSTISPLPGLRITWPTPGWRATDAVAQVVVRPPALPGAKLYVTKGLFPVGPDGGFLTRRVSARAVVAAIRGVPTLQVSKPVVEHLGDGLAVVHVDVHVARSAPRSTYAYMAYRGSSVNPTYFALRKGMSGRVYVGVFRAPYGRDLINIAVEAPSGTVFRRWTALATRALRTLQLPHGLVPGRTIFN